MKCKPADLILTIAIAVKYYQGKGGKHGSVNLGYVISGIAWNPQKVHTIYRSRFAIESSYRMRNQVKPRPQPGIHSSGTSTQSFHPS